MTYEIPPNRVKSLQILSISLIAGLLTISGFLIFVQTIRPFEVLELDFPAWVIPVGFIPLSLIFIILVMPTIKKQMIANAIHPDNKTLVRNEAAREPDTTFDLFNIVNGCTLLPMVIFESVGMIGSVIFCLSGNPLCFIATGYGIAGMFLYFPTKDRLQRQIAEIETELKNRAKELNA